MTITTELPDFVNDTYLRSLHFRSGKGSGKEGDRCSIQEYRSWFNLDPASDAIPEGDSAVVGRYIIGFQDRLISAGATAEQVYELVGRHLPKLRGSYGSAVLEQRRAYMLSDMLVRELAALWFQLTPELRTFAEQLRALSPIVDAASNERAIAVRDAARTAGWNLRSKRLDELAAKVRETIQSRAKPEGLSDRVWKKAAAAAVVAAAAEAEAVVAVAAEAAAVVAEAAAVVAAAEAAAVEAAEAVAAEAAAVAAAVAAEVERRPGESDESFADRVYWAVRNKVWSVFYGETKKALLAHHRDAIERSWALGGRFIEQALALTDGAT